MIAFKQLNHHWVLTAPATVVCRKSVKATMKPIEFPKEEKLALARRLQDYLQEEADVDIGQLGAEFLLEFIGKEIGIHFYNRGLRDAQAAVTAKMDDVVDAIYQLEREA
jgi:uncharacterized protein (DUF2164 family)